MSGSSGSHVLVAVVVFVVLAVIVAGIVMIGPPSDERARRLDARRVADLTGLATAVAFYRVAHGRMPVSLDELGKEPGVQLSNDPVTGSPYAYRIVEGDAYEVCGTFDRPSEPRVQSGVDEWEHGAGRHCFARTVRIPKE